MIKEDVSLLEQLYGFRYRGRAALLCLVLFLIFTGLFQYLSTSYRAAADPTLVDLQLSFSARQFHEIIMVWSKSVGGAIDNYKLMTLSLDYFYPIIYSVMLAFAYSSARGNDKPNKLDMALFVLPFVAAFFDFFENTFHLVLLRNVHNLVHAIIAGYSPLAVGLSAAAATLKFLFFYAGILAV